MDSGTPSIQPLPPEVIAQLTSSIAISHLNGVVLELLKNSLDAGAKTVSINVDFPKGGCVVEDDGHGILPAEFLEGSNLAKLHHSSKFNSQHEVYGRKGVFLASLVSLALVTITSRHESASTTNTVMYHHARAISILTPAPLQHEINSRDHGTRVTVTDLFGNLPVRVKHRALSLRTSQDLDREWDALKHILTAMLLAFQKRVKLVVSDSTKTKKLVIRASDPPFDNSSGTLDLIRIRSILMQAGYVMARDFQSWVTASARTSGIEVQSAISLQPAPTKQVQFISFGINPIFPQSNANVLYNEVNRLFSLSRFGIVDGSPVITDGLEGLHLQGDDRASNKKAPSGRGRYMGKSINKWPMFCIRIDLEERGKAIDRMDGSLETGKTLQSVLDVLVAMIQKFLEEYHFLPRSGAGAKRSHQPQSPTSPVEHQVVKRPRSAAPALASPLAPADSGNTEELFDTRIKLPVFVHSTHHMLRPKTKDFGSWSRIKSGREGGFDEICSGLSRGEAASISNFALKSQTERDRGDSYSSPATPSPSGVQPGEPLDSLMNGDHYRKSASQDGAGNPGLEGLETEKIDELKDDVLHWIDPITKKEILINNRTGQTISNPKQPLASMRGANGIQTAGGLDRHSCPRSSASRPNLWIESLLKEWENPTFRRSEHPVATAFEVPGLHPGVSNKHLLSGAGDFGFMPSTSRFSGRLTKEGLQKAQLIAQVDNKFLLLKLPTFCKENNDYSQQNLVLVDQHAADERCRVEQLFDELCGTTTATPDSSSFCRGRVNTASLPKPISFQVSPQEGELLKSHSGYFESWGCYYSLSNSERNYHTVTVDKLPALIAERCRLEPQLAIDLLRGEIWDRKDHGRRDQTSFSPTLSSGNPEAGNSENSQGEAPPTIARQSWLERISDCPKAIVDLLNSRACRSSIMFNDILSPAECQNLISKLALCAFPFQCAHGRPSMIPIVSLGSSSSSDQTSLAETHSGLNFISYFGNIVGKAPATSMDLPFMEAFTVWKPNVT
ncbi:DNA mismatch repair protein [Histoplasma capsulatum var. duboisii H88]|uniref:DNA mismatch repair protein n=1 Tax=Ajellomyces capsulatus (strain H88) TaxID=544711 RepID=A0A8A1LD73_AJEC8|nr:DNA mismatch repair protein [Histoplasma capsulatum var. duboisii H88]